ncbi:hypothetical protein T440DRAFT_463085 [Plenodomus tracheiphilus IPT5]|uniref:Uncharacterized protein n=1 Tax=Plenodomus tracheiphilus IPT5 TaxID=1408161 RepID=A0A6A7BQX5_9PLEO|nr:hypothetical protein T440DRAFT_463085 [Plenodomus tracheiphilus IPT5]
MTTTTTMFTPHHSSPLARTTSPFKDPRPPPCTPAKTARLWDEYEQRAVENARKRDRTSTTTQPQWSSASNIGGFDPRVALPTTARSSFDFKFRRGHVATPSTTVATCKTCKQAITYASGICERCQRTIVIAPPAGEITPPISPTARTFTSAKHQQPRKPSSEETVMPIAISPTRMSFCPLPSQRVDPPIRLDSLRPPPPPSAILEPARTRKVSLTDPNQPFLRLQITGQQQPYQPRAHSQSHPTTPTFLPTTPPSTSHSCASTRPSSLANIVSLPTSAYPYSRNNSATPSDFSTLFPYASTATNTSPPSLCRSSYALQNTTSAWDDWDSDSEGEKVRLVGWIGRRKAKGKSSDKGSKGSIDSFGSDGDVFGRERRSRESSSREEDRLERVRLETAESARTSRVERDSGVLGKSGKKKTRPNGFVRVISCGCSQA